MNILEIKKLSLFSYLSLHPAHRLLIWGIFILLMAHISFYALCIISMIVLLLAFFLTPKAIKRSFYRIRWLLMTMLVIFAWSTPGVYIFSSWYAPTVEGLYDGCEQVLRLMLVIASLQIALLSINQIGLLSACYYLLYPLRWLGIDSRIFSLRLGLTLAYAKTWLESNAKLNWQQLAMRLDEIENNQDDNKVTEIEIIPFSPKDRWIYIGLLAVLLSCFL